MRTNHGSLRGLRYREGDRSCKCEEEEDRDHILLRCGKWLKGRGEDWKNRCESLWEDKGWKKRNGGKGREGEGGRRKERRGRWRRGERLWEKYMEKEEERGERRKGKGVRREGREIMKIENRDFVARPRLDFFFFV